MRNNEKTMGKQLLKRGIAAWMLVLTFLCSGCESIGGLGGLLTGNQTTVTAEPLAVGIIAGVHGNSCKIDPPEVAELIEEAARTEGQVVIVTSEGQPQVIYHGTALYGDRIQEDWSEEKKDKHYRNAAESVLALYTGVQAVSTGNDCLKAIHLASSALQAMEQPKKVLLICGSGLSTVPPLDFRANILSAEPEQVAEDLAGANALPDLQGTVVIWFGLGATASPQPELNYEDRERLQEIYDAILRQAGADSVEFRTNPFTEAMDSAALPEVPVVEVREETQQEYIPSWSASGGLVFSEDRLYFLPDKAEFKDEELARETLRPVAEELSAHPELKILLAGCTASLPTNEGWCWQLSRMRAEASAQMLRELMVGEYGAEEGKAAEQIGTVGLAYFDPWHLEDLDEMTGRQIPDMAVKNRKIVLLDYFGDEAQAILGAFGGQ